MPQLLPELLPELLGLCSAFCSAQGNLDLGHVWQTLYNLSVLPNIVMQGS